MTTFYNNIPTYGLAIDWETSGYSTPNFSAKHQGLSVGAIVFDVRTLVPIEKFYREVKFNPKYEWSAQAEAIHGLTKEYLDLHGQDQETVAIEFANLIIKYFSTGHIILMGHKVNFDRSFTDQLMSVIGIELKYHSTTIDTCTLATVLMEMNHSEEIFQTLGLPPREKHNSLEDIEYTLESVRRMKDLFLQGMVINC